MCFLQSEGESGVSGGGVVRWGAKGGEGGEEEGGGRGGGSNEGRGGEGRGIR